MPVDAAQAAFWCEKSTKQGYAEAEDLLGDLYDKGLGVPADHKQAANWYRKAAEQGDAFGEYKLGMKYQSMQVGTFLSWCSESYKWNLKAAEQGYTDAEEQVSYSYQGVGCGVKANSEQAAFWMQKASQQKNAAAEAAAAVRWKHFRKDVAARLVQPGAALWRGRQLQERRRSHEALPGIGARLH
jgi:hypothetical protein